MTELFLLSYLLAPALMLACCLGGGLLIRRATGGTLPAVCVLPLGYAAMVATGAFLTTWDATAELAGPAFVLLGLAGLVVERRHLHVSLRPAARWAWAAGAAASAYAVVIAPALLSGRATFTGYGRIVDIAHQFDFAQYLVTEGRVRPTARDTSYLEVVTKTLDIGYPGGAQSTFGGFASVLATDLAWVYQSFLALSAAMTALAVFALLRGAVRSPAMRALAGGVAAQANVTIGYGLVGGFKELVSAALLVLTAALVREAVLRSPSARSMLAVAVAAAGCFAALNLTVVPWLGLLLIGGLVVAVTRTGLTPRRAWLRPLGAWAAMAAMLLILAAPTVWQAVKLAPVASQAEGADRTVIADLGNMSEPLPVRAAAGVWISGDYRSASLGDTPLTTIVIAVVLACALIGVAASLRRRDWTLPLLGAATAVALAYFALRTGPWIQLKAIALSGPVTLALAFAGAAALGRATRGARVGSLAAWALTVIIGVGVLAGNANAYHDITLAPTERLRDLERIGERFAGQGPALYPAFEEYAEYFLRRSDAIGTVNTAGEGPLAPLAYRPQAAAQAGVEAADGRTRQAWDLDDFEPAYLQQFRVLVMRRGPHQSRAPANFRLAQRSRFHDVWLRQGPPRPQLVHVALPGWGPAGVQADCDELQRRAQRTGADAQVAYALAPRTSAADLGALGHSATWRKEPGSVVPYGPGWAQGTLELPEQGRYRLWIAGPTQRQLRVEIDGRQVATVQDAWSYPRQWNLLGEVEMAGGRHTVRVEREAGSLAPGDGAGGTAVGPVVLELLDGRRGEVRRAPAGGAGRLCRQAEDLDWIELLPEERPGARQVALRP